jgi:hypothetical protein
MALAPTERGLELNSRSALSLSDSLIRNIKRDKQLDGCGAPEPHVHLALNNAQAPAFSYTSRS